MAEYIDIYNACRIDHIQHFQGIFIQDRPLFYKTMYRCFKSDSRRDDQICIALGVLEKMLASSRESDSCNAKIVISAAEDVKFASYGGLNASNALYIGTSDKMFFSLQLTSSLHIYRYGTWPEHDFDTKSPQETSVVNLRVKWNDRLHFLISHS